MYEDYLKTQEELESVLLAGSQTTLTTSESSGVSSGSGTTSSSFSTDSSSTLSLNQNITHGNKKTGTERHKGGKKAANAIPNRVMGKQNALGSIFSTAWSKGVEDNQADYSSSISSIPESPWSPANNSMETPSYESTFDFTSSVSSNPVTAPKNHQSEYQENSNTDHVPLERTSTQLNGDKNTMSIEPDTTSVDCLLDRLSETVSNGVPPPPPPPPLPGDRSIPPPPPPPPITPKHMNGNINISEAVTTSNLGQPPQPPPPPPCPGSKPSDDGRPQPPPQSMKPKKNQNNLALLVPPPPPPPGKPVTL